MKNIRLVIVLIALAFGTLYYFSNKSSESTSSAGDTVTDGQQVETSESS